MGRVKGAPLQVTAASHGEVTRGVACATLVLPQPGVTSGWIGRNMGVSMCRSILNLCYSDRTVTL